MQLNIVHPYVYYTRDDKYDFSRSPENRDNRTKLAKLVRASLKSGVDVLAHEVYSGQVAEVFGEIMFGNSPIYKMLDKYKVNWISTTDYGLPLPDDKPRSISKKEWDQLKKLTISHSEMKKKVERHEIYFFVGGFLDLCLANCAGYIYTHTGSEERKLFYIPELCVVKNQGNLEKVLPKLEERRILPLDFESALERIKQNK